jgi:hypothetical protein
MSNKTKAILASWGRSFAAACVAQYLALGVAAFDVNGEILKSVFNAGVAAVIPVILRWLNPNDEAFGRGA